MDYDNHDDQPVASGSGSRQSPGADGPPSKKPRRAYRACIACRKRKLKCDLGDPEAPTSPPCKRCRRASRECILDSGAATRDRSSSTLRAISETPVPVTAIPLPPQQPQGQPMSSGVSYSIMQPIAGPSVYHHDAAFNVPAYSPNHSQIQMPPPHPAALPPSHNAIPTAAASQQPPAPRQQPTGQGSPSPPHDDGENDKDEDVLVSSNLHNPNDAMRLLISASTLRADRDLPIKAAPRAVLSSEECWARWIPIARGMVTRDETRALLIYFETEMAPLYPLLVPQIFEPSHLPELTSSESILLAAMVSIAARHSPLLVGRAELIHANISAWIRTQLVTLLDGSPRLRHIATVEALLLLAEWPPLTPKDPDDTDVADVPYSEWATYDGLSWSLIGSAVRLAQELGLQYESMYPFENDQPLPWDQARNLRCWLLCYNADVHVSVRLGRNAVVQAYMTSSWWEHVTSMSSKTASEGSGDIWSQDQTMSSGFLAALMGTIQDRLYPDKEMTRQILRKGHWESFLRSLEQELKVIRKGAQKILEQDTIQATLLRMEISYVHLFGNAIALRALQERLKRRMKTPLSIYAAPSLLNLAEGPWCIDALAAAQSTLQLAVSVLEPKGFLRVCPTRIFQRILFAAVFLFKALAVGIVEHGQTTILGLLGQVITALERSAVDASHISRVFSVLLERLQAQCRPTILSERTSGEAHAQPQAPPQPSNADPDYNGGQYHDYHNAGMDNFDMTMSMPWDWDPSTAALNTARDQDLMFQALWSNDLGLSNSNLNLLGTLVGDGFA